MKRKIFYVAICLMILAVFIVVPTMLWFSSGNMNLGFMISRGNSMAPTIADGQIVYVQEPQYERGEIVVAKIPQTDEYFMVKGIPMIKRIVGLPGEVVRITTEGIYINDELLNEDYVYDIEKTLTDRNTVTECILSDNEYFLVGDNREESFDSRNLGSVNKSLFLYGVTVLPNKHTTEVKNTALCVTIILFILLVFIYILLYRKMFVCKRH